MTKTALALFKNFLSLSKLIPGWWVTINPQELFNFGYQPCFSLELNGSFVDVCQVISVRLIGGILLTQYKIIPVDSNNSMYIINLD